MASNPEKPNKRLQKKLEQAKALAAQETKSRNGTQQSGEKIPRMAAMDIPEKYPHKPEPGRNGSQPPGQTKTQVVVRQTPVPEVKIFGQTSPRKYTTGMKASDKLAKWAGSWLFITSFMIFLVIWMLINFYMISVTWDPYPFILLNLVLSCLAAIQAPVILMSQNRAADRDRAKAERDYAVNRKAEREIELIKKDLDYIKKKIAEVGSRLR